MVFCNRTNVQTNYWTFNSHNPYFNRWFSAMCNSNEYIGLGAESQSLF